MSIDRTSQAARADAFGRLHAPGTPLLLANAWDAGSARLIEHCGASAIATTSAGLAWSRGYPDGDVLPPGVLATAIAEIARVISVPLSVDAEGGYADDPTVVGENVRAIIDAGGIGINLEDGSGSPDLLVAKIEAARAAADGLGVHLFINARTDVYLAGLVAPEHAVDESIARAARYREAGADGIFVPAVRDPDEIRTVAGAIGLPLNVLVVPGLPTVAELASLGVARVSAGSGIAQMAAGVIQGVASAFLAGELQPLSERSVTYGELNALFTAAGR